MAKQIINLGTAPTGVGGDTPRSAFTKTQANFDELYNADATNYKKSNILGTVSQLSGVPTGAIFEKVVNANGEATKFADGRLICVGTIPDFTVGANAIATVSPLAQFPVIFADISYSFQPFGTPQASLDVYGYISDNSRLNWSAKGVYRNGPTAQTIANGRYLAIGRWF